MPRMTIWPSARLTRPSADSPFVTTLPLCGSTVARVADSRSAPPFPDDEELDAGEYAVRDVFGTPGIVGTVGVGTVGVGTVGVGTVGVGTGTGTLGFEPGEGT